MNNFAFSFYLCLVGPRGREKSMNSVPNIAFCALVQALCQSMKKRLGTGKENTDRVNSLKNEHKFSSSQITTCKLHFHHINSIGKWSQKSSFYFLLTLKKRKKKVKNTLYKYIFIQFYGII